MGHWRHVPRTVGPGLLLSLSLSPDPEVSNFTDTHACQITLACHGPETTEPLTMNWSEPVLSQVEWLSMCYSDGKLSDRGDHRFTSSDLED